MPTNIRQLEARLAQVEKELADLKSNVEPGSKEPWYREISGCFAGDPAFKEIVRLGRLIRQGKIKG